MVDSAPRVVVVGGGIMGASIAWHLTRMGARVTVLEKQGLPAAGVTGHSYGWVGTSNAFPSHDPCFGAKMEAVADFVRLQRALGPLPIAARGAIVWLETDEATAALIAAQQAAGVRMRALNRGQIADLVPRLAAPPTLAAWAPDDVAVEPIGLTRQFATEPHLVRHLLYGQELELRPALEGGLVSAEDYPEEGESGLAELAERTAATIAGMFTRAPRLSLLSVKAARRPMTDDGAPLRTFLSGVDGLYVAVAHPGVMLAPRLGRLAAGEIMRA